MIQGQEGQTERPKLLRKAVLTGVVILFPDESGVRIAVSFLVILLLSIGRFLLLSLDHQPLLLFIAERIQNTAGETSGKVCEGGLATRDKHRARER